MDRDWYYLACRHCIKRIVVEDDGKGKRFGCAASVMLMEQMLFEGGDVDFYPEEFRELVRKRYTFNTDMDRFNIKSEYHVYTVTCTTDDEAILAKETEIKISLGGSSDNNRSKKGSHGNGSNNSSDGAGTSNMPTSRGKRVFEVVDVEKHVQPCRLRRNSLCPSWRRNKLTTVIGPAQHCLCF